MAAGPTNLSKLIEAIPNHVTNLPFLIAVLNIEMTGLNAYMCKYLVKSVFDCVLLTIMFNTWRTYVWSGDGSEWRGMSHIPFTLLR